MSVWKAVGNSLTGLGKHVAKTVVAEPVEIVRDMVGQNLEKGNSQSQPADDQAQADPLADLAKGGFKTQGDFEKYQGLSGEKDDLEIQMLRKQLSREWGLDTSIEGGMAKARAEWEQKEEQRKQVEEKEEEQKKEFEFMKKKQDDLGLKAAKAEASAENKAWGAG